MRFRSILLATFWGLLATGATAQPAAPSAPAGPAASHGFTPALFDQFVAMRVGAADGAPVWWYCAGELYSYPEGKLLARVEGVDVAHLLAGDSHAGQDAVQLSRKTFVYRDPASGAVLKEVNGQPLPAIAYPYQLIRYQLSGDKLQTYVEQGSGARFARMGPDDRAQTRKLGLGGEVTAFSVPLFLSVETPRGKYEAYENYDFLLEPAVKGLKTRYQLIWNRFGDLPPAFGTGKGVMQLLCHRVEQYTDLPKTIREYVEKEAILYKRPPQDMAEVRELQAAK